MSITDKIYVVQHTTQQTNRIYINADNPLDFIDVGKISPFWLWSDYFVAGDVFILGPI